MKMSLCCLVLSLLAGSSLCAQEFRSVVSLTASANAPVTRAVVIGISDYQDPAIPDLKYADRDAEAFAAWLQSPAGGGVATTNIQLLRNEQASLGQVFKELEWLVEQSQEGDRAIVYFSGHGDIEARTRRKEGFLLCYNSPPNNYRTNAFAVYWLQDIIEQIALDKKAQAVIITDACRAGKLAGSEISGAQLTTAALQEQFANEIKILSCQPNEYSLEGEQWGGGRGAFSYHLMDGLYGLADQDEDGRVTLKEINRYLEDHVGPETAPHRQNPLVVGDKEVRLAKVIPEVLAFWRQKKQDGLAVLRKTDPKGFEYLMQTQADSSVRALYLAFFAALERGDLLPTDSTRGRSADDYYRRLLQEPTLSNLQGMLSRNFVAALVDEAQTITNKLLKTDPNVVSDNWARPFLFDHIPAFLTRATEILGENHYLYKSLKAKQFFFEAKTCLPEKFPDIPPDSVARMAGQKYEKALHYDSSAAYVHVEYAMFLWFKMFRFDEALRHAIRALDLAPNWVYAHYIAGVAYRLLDSAAAVNHLHRAIELDSTFLMPYQELAQQYKIRGDQSMHSRFSALFIQKTMALISADPLAVPVFYRSLLGAALWFNGKPEEAKAVLLEAERLSKGQSLAVYQFMGTVCYDLKQYEEALRAAQKQLELAPFNAEGYNQMIDCYQALDQPEQVLRVLERAVTVFDNPGFRNFYRLQLAEKYQASGYSVKAEEQWRKTREELSDFANPAEMNFLARARLGLGEPEALPKTIEEGLQKFPGNVEVYYQAACLYSLAKQEQKSVEWLDRAIQNGFTDRQWILQDPDLKFVRDTAGFHALMQKYFPEKAKD